MENYTFYSVKQLSEILDLSTKTIKKYLNDGTIRGRKIGNKWAVTPYNLKKYVEGEE